MLKNIYIAGCLVLMTGAIVSCKKDKSYDVKGDPQTRFYTNNEALGDAPVNSKSYSVVNYPNVAGSGLINLSTTVPAKIQFPVFSTKPVGQNVTITAELDNSLITAYNAAHSTNYVAFPAGLLKTDVLAAQIASGATRSTDSITIETDAALLNTLTEKAYMAPIRLKAASNSSGTITTTESAITYIVVNMELRRIKYLAAAAEAQGALITPRTAWTVLFTPAPTTVGSIIDGSTTTFSRWTASPVQVDVNMQDPKNVTGLRLYTSNSATYTPTQVEVSLSQDGINYDVIGSPLKANLTYASSYNYILFYKAITAKFVRLRLWYSTSTNTQNFRVTELDVYAN